MANDVCIKVFFHAKVLETNQTFATMETVDFEKPELNAFVSGHKVSHPFYYITNERGGLLTKQKRKHNKIDLKTQGSLWAISSVD